MATDKTSTPGYGSFKSLTTFFNARRDDGHITSVVDRSLMSNFNGSTANELLATLRFLKMIDDKGVPSPLYAKYVQASDQERKSLLADVVRDAYPFVFASAGFDVERETSARMAEVFRAQGISGSTLARAISFFLAASKEAGIKVSPNIKPPQLGRERTSKNKKAAAVQAPAHDDDEENDEDQEDLAGFQSFEIPIPISRKVKILIPEDWSSEDWDLLQTMLKIYIDGWKRQDEKSKPKGQQPDQA